MEALHDRSTLSRPRPVTIGTLSAAGLAALAALPSSPHAAPGAATGWRRWLWSLPARSADPLEALTAGARLVAMAVLAYLVLIAVANLALSFLPAAHRRSGTWRALQSLTPRWLAVASIGVAIGAGPVAAQQPAGPTDGRAAPVMELLDGAAGSISSGPVAPPDTTRSTVLAATTVAPRATSPDAGARLGPDTSSTADPAARVDDAESPMIDPSSPLQPIPDPASPPETSGPAAPPEQTTMSGPATAPTLPSVDQLPPSVAVHRVQPGEHFWSIAEQVVTERVGPTATDAAIAAYWRQLVEVNRDRLVDPDDPDLILPGQVFDLPW
ncbi:MAG: hypothetical protein ACK4V6_07335 [Microthrixaceae bacterium]